MPDEDNTMRVYGALQSNALIQRWVSSVIGVPHHNVKVSCKRIGGAFGGKISRNLVIFLPTAFAAHKLQKPVKVK